MRTGHIIFFAALSVPLLPEYGSATLMLGSLLMALKGGMLASKLGMGGLLAMVMAATKNQYGTGLTTSSSNSYSRLAATNTLQGLNLGKQRRNRRDIDPALVPDLPLLLNATVTMGNSTEALELSVEKLAHELNNVSSPLTQRVMRQAAILDQLSCLPRVICGLNAQTPSKQTTVLNDYGFLMKFLFERDDDDADDAKDQDDEDDEEDDNARADAIAIKKSSNSTLPGSKTKGKKRKKPSKDSEEDSDENEDDIEVEDGEFEDFDEDEQFDEMAEEELIKDDPTMLSYILADAHMRMKKHKGSAYNVDHSDLAGYDKNSYITKQNPLLNTASAQAALKGGSSIYLRRPQGGSNSKGTVNKHFQFQLGKDKDKGNPSLFKHILPSFIYKKINSNPGGSSNPVDDGFSQDPFFDGFRKRRNLEKVEGESVEKAEAEVLEASVSPIVAAYIQRKQRQLEQSKNPLTKYKIAERAGKLLRNQRQCRMLFARCPYTFSEITTMIDNMRKLLAAQATVGDQVVNLKQTGGTQQDNPQKSGSSSNTLSSGSVLNLQTGSGSSSGGVTSIMHQLDNGDKVEIMLKIKPNDGKTTSHGSKSPTVITQSDSLLLSHYRDKELLEAHKNLIAMKKQFQHLAKLHNATLHLQNSTSIKLPSGIFTKNDNQYPVLQGVPGKQPGNRYTVKKPGQQQQEQQRPGTGSYPQLQAVPSWAGSQYSQKLPSQSSLPELSDSSSKEKPDSDEDGGQGSTSQEDKVQQTSQEESPKKKPPTKVESAKKKKPEEEEEEDEDDDEDDGDGDEEEDDDPLPDSGEFVPSIPPEVPPLPLFRNQQIKAQHNMNYKKTSSQTLTSRTNASPVVKTRPPAPLPTKPAPYKIRRNKGASRRSGKPRAVVDSQE